MRTALTLVAGATLLLTGCGIGHAPRLIHAEQSGSSHPVSVTPVNGLLPSPTRPASRPTSSTRPVPPVPSTSAAPTTNPTAASPRTRQIVLRPVTDTGRAAPGYTTVVLSADHQLDCGGSSRHHAYQSPVAVDTGPVACSPSSEYALACWNGPSATTALCYQDPWQRQVVQVHTGGRLPVERAPERPSPLGVVLSDGTRCSLRGGGAWALLDGHPDMYARYGCEGGMALWAGRRADGIDRAQPLWTVRLAPTSGHGRLRAATVRSAYFVGASRG